VATIVEITDVTKEDILADPQRFRAELFLNGVVGFRGINLSQRDFVQVTDALGFNDAPLDFYRADKQQLIDLDAPELQDHSIDPNCLHTNEDFKPRFESMWNGVGTGGEVPEAGEFYYPGQDKPTRQTFMWWHMEALPREHLTRVKSINMHTFTAPPTTGALGFVDMHQAYLDLPDKWKKELQNARKLETQVLWLPEGQLQYPHPVFVEHWWHINDHKILATQGFNDECDPPFFWDMDTVGSLTEKDIAHVNEWTFNYQVNPDNQSWWDWEQGDLVVFDAQQLSIAWSAGFGLGELVFDSMTYNGGHDEDLLGHAPGVGDPRETYPVAGRPETDHHETASFEVKPYVVPEGHEYHG
jgi:hypothetical protein